MVDIPQQLEKAEGNLYTSLLWPLHPLQRITDEWKVQSLYKVPCSS